MARRLTDLIPGLGLTVLLIAALGGIVEAGLAMTSPLTATEPGMPSESSPEPLAVLPDLPEPFTPSALIAQPVFAVNRMPPPPSLPAAEPPVLTVVTPSQAEPSDPPPPDYILAGIMISESDRRVLLKKHKTEKGQWVSSGQITGDGWTVLTVKPEEAIIVRSHRQFKLQFSSFRRSVAKN